MWQEKKHFHFLRWKILEIKSIKDSVSTFHEQLSPLSCKFSPEQVCIAFLELVDTSPDHYWYIYVEPSPHISSGN